MQVQASVGLRDALSDWLSICGAAVESGIEIPGNTEIFQSALRQVIHSQTLDRKSAQVIYLTIEAFFRLAYRTQARRKTEFGVEIMNNCRLIMLEIDHLLPVVKLSKAKH